MASPLNPSVEYAGVRFTPDQIELRQGGETVAAVPRQQVRCVRAMRGLTAERPLLQIILGVAVLLALLWDLKPLFSTLLFGGRLYISDTQILMAVGLALVSGWLLFSALKRGPYLLIETEKGPRKFPMRKEAQAELVRKLAGEAARLGYAVDLTDIAQVFAR